MANNYTNMDENTLAQMAKVIYDWGEKVITQGYDILNETTAKIGAKIDENIFEAISSIFFNSIAYNLIGIIVVVWLIYHMRNGFSKDDIFKGGIWLLTLCFVYGVLSSYSAYKEFNSWFLIPQHILQAALAHITDGKNTAQILADTFSQPSKIGLDAVDYGIQSLEKGNKALGYKGNGGGGFANLTDIYNFAYASVAMTLWGFVVLSIAFLILLIFLIQIATMLSLTIFGSFAPIMMICLITPQTRGFFFSWLRNFISISLYLPLSLLPVLIIQIMTKDFDLDGPNLYVNTSYYVFLYFIGILLAFYIIFKIPEWINIIMGTQEGHSNMAMAQSVLAGGFTMAKIAGGKGLNMTQGTLLGAYSAAAASSRFAKDPKGHISAGANLIKSGASKKWNQVKEQFGFKASSHHHE